MAAVSAPEAGPDAGAIWHYGDPFGEQRDAENAAVLIDRSHRAVLTLTGPEHQTWLHTVCSQHVSELPDGASTQNLTLDGKGHVQNHWLQTELNDTSYLDTEPWQGQPLLDHFRRMVFWADVQMQLVDMAVLSLLGPGLAEPAVLDVLGIDSLPAAATAVPVASADVAFVRRTPGERSGQVELDLVVPRNEATDWHLRLTRAGVRPAGVWAYEANRVVARRARLGVDTDDRSIPQEHNWLGGPGVGAVHLKKGCYSGQETVARIQNLGKPPRMMVLLHLDGSVDRPSTGEPMLSNDRSVGRLGTVVDHVELGPIALALLKRGLPADTPLGTGPDGEVAATIDPDSLPPPDQVPPGRAAVNRLKGRG